MTSVKPTRKKIDEKKFFEEGTLRICSSLEIEKALWQCFDFIKNYIPAQEIYLQYFDADRGVTEILATANQDGGRLTNRIIKYTPEIAEVIRKDESLRQIIVNKADEHYLFADRLHKIGMPKASFMMIRLELEGKRSGGVSLWADGWNRFTDEHLNLFVCLKKPFAIALSNYRHYKELLELKNTLMDDKKYFQQQLYMHTGSELIGADFGLRGVIERVKQVAPLDSPVLLRGETGTGKDVIAHLIHNLSRRRTGPFIPVNCGAIPESLMDSELFGHEKGAFTGALETKRGRFERAHEGTLFLDEIGELSPSLQLRLLRVLQDNKIERVGGSELIDVNIRVIAATHRNLEAMIQQSQFREDLYFRLQVFPIFIPPLRLRTTDIPALVQHFIRKKSRAMGLKNTPVLRPGALERLNGYPWPGNVRELENMVERALILHPEGPVEFDVISPVPIRQEKKEHNVIQPDILSVDRLLTEHIQSILDMTNGKINGKNGAAELLGLNPSTLRQKMRKMNIPFGRKVYNKTA
ncbi:MAG: sigma 54-interacting transcriptional regulator [Deltaproteobacteria bacterium]|nr:sigma 54-interacting transcriptional regulator [Deltaproteobacteria bacterium]